MEKGMATHSSILVLENPKDRGAWWAAVHRVTQSRTRQKQLSTHTLLHWQVDPLPPSHRGSLRVTLIQASLWLPSASSRSTARR